MFSSWIREKPVNMKCHWLARDMQVLVGFGQSQWAESLWLAPAGG
jgi:hypothetical protein